jgi:hypothetical protein
LEKFAEAHESLKFIRVLTPSKEADKYNLLGFTARKSGDLNAGGRVLQEGFGDKPKTHPSFGISRRTLLTAWRNRTSKEEP